MTVSQPTAIGRYRIERLLGAGAMGFVYLANDPDLDRLVAVKTLRDLSLDPDALKVFLERFRNEARAAARLHHPGIVQVYDVGDDADTGPFLVFEYVAGSTLRALLRTRGAFCPDDVVVLAEQVGEALDFAHGNSVIHRDIKPDNLLVTEYGECKLADFGVARIPNAALTREGQFLGTPCYAAPETLRDGDYGPHTDLFSFAAVLYEAVTGKRAFPGDDALVVANKVVHDDPIPPTVAAPLADIPPAVDAVLLRALSKDPLARPSTALALAEELRDAYVAANMLPDAGAGNLSLNRVAIARGETSRKAPGCVSLALFAALALTGVTLVWVFSAPLGLDAVDGGFADGGVPSLEAGQGQGIESRDAGTLTLPLDATQGDASFDATVDAQQETGPPGPFPGALSGDPEELAKDALDRARAALAAGKLAEAAAALDLARSYDPGLDEISDVAAQLRTLREADSPATP